MNPKQPSSRSSRTCSAVRGCKDPAAYLSFKMPSGAIRRICAKHLMRHRRTGKLTSEVEYGAIAKKRKAREAKLKEQLHNLGLLIGRYEIVAKTGCGRRLCLISNPTKRAITYLSFNLVDAWKRRGWVSVGKPNADGWRTFRITAAGWRARK